MLEPMKMGYNTYALEMFRCNEVMPYFNGKHYAHLLKLVLDRYSFEKRHLKLIKRVGLTWSLTNDVKVKKDFADSVRELINPSVTFGFEFFNNPVSMKND